jgi:26S proteasome regulatory subunit T6
MGRAQATGEGLTLYYRGKIEQLEVAVKDKLHNLRRLEAQRNELNTQGMQLK